MPIVIFHAPPSELPIVNIVQIAKPLSEKKKSFDSGALGDKLPNFFILLKVLFNAKNT